MQEAIPCRTYIHGPVLAAGNTSPEGDGVHSSSTDQQAGTDSSESKGHVQKMALENAVVVFGRRGCCMCHVVKTLLLGHGVNPAVFEIDECDEATVVDQLSRIGVEKRATGDGIVQFPAVFVGGKLFGGLEQVMATHISGELVSILKGAGALWL